MFFVISYFKLAGTLRSTSFASAGTTGSFTGKQRYRSPGGHGYSVGWVVDFFVVNLGQRSSLHFQRDSPFVRELATIAEHVVDYLQDPDGVPHDHTRNGRGHGAYQLHASLVLPLDLTGRIVAQPSN